MSRDGAETARLSVLFDQVLPAHDRGTKPPAKAEAYPFSIRLTKAERAMLEDQAGAQPLGAYIRQRLLGDHTTKRRQLRKPSVDDQKLGLALAMLGQTHYASNLNQLAHHANAGNLPIAADTEEQLKEACQAVSAMRDCLLEALGKRVANENDRS